MKQADKSDKSHLTFGSSTSDDEKILPSPYTASFQALSVNAFRWRIRDERPGDAKQSRSAHAWAFLHFWNVHTFNWNNL